MFEQVAIKLLQGAFVCEFTAPEAFRWLSEDERQADVAAYLDRLGRTLSKTQNGQAYYASWKSIGTDERGEVKRAFSSIKQTLRPVIHFITLCMDAEKKDSAPSPGDRFEYATMLKTVSDNPHLAEMLREFVTISKDFTVVDSSLKGMLDKVIQQLERWGYLVLVNKEHASYRWTGKLEYYLEIVDFLIEHEEIAVPGGQDPDGVAEQRKLV